jgi:hypothetical protein
MAAKAAANSRYRTPRPSEQIGTEYTHDAVQGPRSGRTLQCAARLRAACFHDPRANNRDVSRRIPVVEVDGSSGTLDSDENSFIARVDERTKISAAARPSDLDETVHIPARCA